MMDNSDQRLSAMTDMNGESVLMSNMTELLPNLPNMSNIMDDQLMQLLDNQNYMMTDGSHLVPTQRNVTPMDSHSVNNGQNSSNSIQSLDRHSVDSCNYVSNQYEPQYHSSSDSHRFKYRSSGLSSVPETVTHVSETDNSISGQNSYGNVGNISVPQQNYPMTTINNWSQSHNHMIVNQSRGPKDMVMSGSVQHNHMNAVKATPPSGYIPRHRIPNFVPNVSSMNPSTTSTPVNQTLNNMVIHNNNHNNINNIHVNRNHSQMMNEGLVAAHRVESTAAYKRTVIVFKVIDQIVDSSGKVLKEEIVKNEEIIRDLGKVEWNDTLSSTTPLSSISHVSRFASNPSSGALADVSSSPRSTCSSLETRHNQNNESLTKSHSVHNKSDIFHKTPVPVTPIPPIPPIRVNTNHKVSKEDNSLAANVGTRNTLINEIKEENVKSSTNIVNIESVVELKINERDEEERRETATALLSLTQRSLNIDCNPSEQTVSSDFAIRAGNRVMAKWRDKNFYPAVISKHLPQNNKWSVVFEDRATRSLFETELIQLTHLTHGQDVMVTISEGFCAKSTIKNVVNDTNGLFFEVEHLKDDKQVSQLYPLKDIFLNVEQSANIWLKSSKPAANGAVFADVDLDNIVSGKRVRITAKAEKLIEKPIQQFKNGRRRAADAVSVDIDYVNDGEEEDDDDDQAFSYKTKKRANIRNNKKKVESQGMLFNNEHSLSISPRAARVHSSIPAQELIKLLGPLPEIGSLIFQSVCFLLTCGDRNRSEDMCSEQSNPERSTPFDKSYLTKQIETGGGVVFETFDDMKTLSENQDMVLIADTYHRSIKYIQCLAAGISIASHLWVIDCCRQNKYLKRDNYTLPAGFSIITNALPSDKNTFKKSSTLFRGTKFYFGSQTPEKLHSLWAPVLSAAQAVIVENNTISVTNLSRKHCVN
ncbi:unnamed protein product [Medioppia subpectinata]|uniref:BRCT domain-containing protein n=1 Tax=Medioppia subpectinata TaxID=1979941 RepID=A0A7R9KSJ6_9ACAR|nr:unnamed protein product [Medioppia subpectinata]CAG2108995.1 unnamed protein product [Medioppia subpectinata]